MSPVEPSGESAGAELRQLLANAVALLLAYVLPRLFTVASVVVAARVLGPGDFGVYGTAAALAVILSILATLGMQPLLVREIARDRRAAPRLLGAAHRIKTGTNLLMLAALLAMARWVLDYDSTVQAAAMVLGVGYALGAYAENLAAYYQAVERMGRWTEAVTLFGLVSGASGIVLLLATGSLVAFCAGPALGWTAALGWLLLRAPDRVRRGPERVGRSDVTGLLRGLAPFAAAFVGITVYCKMDVLLLARWSGDEAVGVYTAAYKFVDLFQALVLVAAGAVYPRLSRKGMGGDASAALGPNPARRSTELVLLGAVPVGVGLHLLAGPVTGLLFGPAYAASVPALRVLGLVLPLLALSIHGGYVLGAAGRMLPVAALYAGGIGVNVALNAVLIPLAGARGAALARLGSEALLAGGFVAVLAAVASAAPRASVLGAAGLAGAAGLGFLFLPDPTGGWMRGLLSVGACALVYRWSGVVAPADVGAARRAVVRRLGLAGSEGGGS